MVDNFVSQSQGQDTAPKRAFPRVIMAIAGVMLLIIVPLELWHHSNEFTPLTYATYAFLVLLALSMLYSAYKPNPRFIKASLIFFGILILLFFTFNPQLVIAIFVSNPFNGLLALLMVTSALIHAFSHKNKNGSFGLPILIIIGVVILVGYGVYYFTHQQTSQGNPTSQGEQTNGTQPPGWVTETASGVTVSYPPNWTRLPSNYIFMLQLTNRDAQGNPTAVAARVAVSLRHLDTTGPTGTQTFDELVTKFRQGLSQSGATITTDQQVTFDGKPAQLISYTRTSSGLSLASSDYLIDWGNNYNYLVESLIDAKELPTLQPIADQIIQSVKLPQ